MSDLAALRELADASVLVTGATGFIGSHLCTLLCQLGAMVHGVYRRDADRFDGVRWHQTDLVDADAAAELVRTTQPTHVFHLAGVTSAARTVDLVLPTFHANATSTVNLLTALAGTRVSRFVLAGSLEAPIAGAGGVPVASSPYAASKLVAAAYAAMAGEVFGIPAVNCRIFMVYGPGQRDLRKFVPYVTLSLLRGESPRLSSGRREVDWVYVGDVSRDLAMAAIAPGLAGQTLDVGSGTLTSIRDVAIKLNGLTGTGQPLTFGQLPDRPQEQIFAADIAGRDRLLGPARPTPLDDGLSRTVAWYRDQLARGLVGPLTA